MIKHALAISLLTSAVNPLIAQQSPATAPVAAPAEASEFLVGPVTTVQDVNGTPVAITISTFFQVMGRKEGLYLVSRMEVDLSDLQRQFPSLIGALPLPNDNCASYKPDNLVVSLPTRELRADGDRATMAVSGKVDIWSCFENPIPKTKLEWELKNIGFGIRTKVPVLKTWRGDPFKNKTASQPFDATLPIYFRRINDNSLAIVTGDPNVNLKGQYVFITKGILSLANIDINDEARKAISKAIAPNDLTKTIPEEFSAMQPAITNATFYAKDGQLFARIDARALIPPEKITEWVKLMMNKPKS